MGITRRLFMHGMAAVGLGGLVGCTDNTAGGKKDASADGGGPDAEQPDRGLPDASSPDRGLPDAGDMGLPDIDDMG